MRRSWMAWVMLAWLAGIGTVQAAEPLAVPEYWDLTVSDVTALVERSLAVAPKDRIALDAAWRWYREHGTAQQRKEIGGRYYPYAAWPNGNPTMLQQLISELAPEESRALARSFCQGFAGGVFLTDAGGLAAAHFMEWVAVPECLALQPVRQVLRFVEMARMQRDRQPEVASAFVWLQQRMAPNDMQRIRLARLLWDAQQYAACQDALRELQALRPRNLEIQTLYERCMRAAVAALER